MASSTNNISKVLPITKVKKVLLVGCGGTGSILAEHIARMIAGFGLEVEFIIYDGDTVEQVNIGRQNFFPWEVGANKAQALALRLAGQFGLEVTAKAKYLDKQDNLNITNNLVIGCTDTLQSRRLIASGKPPYWLDVGNELSHGQAVIGTTHDSRRLKSVFDKFNRTPHVADLPDISALNPSILTARKTRIRAGCADGPFDRQGFGVNAMAALAAATIAKQILVERQIRFAGVYFDVTEGRMLPKPITQDLFRPWK